jgi:hypothetical protein
MIVVVKIGTSSITLPDGGIDRVASSASRRSWRISGTSVIAPCS